MRLEAGARLGPYEIEELVGAGGMGEVYRALDTRLDRLVALKVLPDRFAADETVRARFEREAKAISSLSHPNICTLHDVGHEDGTEYLVMEYLEGESLAERLGRGHLPLDEAIRYGIQIAEALDRAHRSGIVHRDLKPANVILTASGAKLLDFGLAKAGAFADGGAPDLTSLPTEQRDLTEAGTILGTFQYMAPEQLEGQEADARTDIFGFGALLYEMVTGHTAFQGKSRVSLIASIMEHEPQPIANHQPLSPPALDRLIRQCLKKDPEVRWQTAHDLSLQLRWIEEGGSQLGVPAPVAARRRHREWGSWLVAAAAILAAVVFATMWVRAINAPEPVIRTSILPEDMSGYSPGDGLSLSPDGSRLVYVAASEGRQQLWVRELDNDKAQPLRDTEGGYYPFWSPDGQHLGFFADNKLKRISVSGGGARSLADVTSARGGSWSDDGWIVYSPSSSSGLMRVPESGGQAVGLTEIANEVDAEVNSHRWPWFLPGGRTLLFLAQTSEGGTANDPSTIRSLDLETGESTVLVTANSFMQYAAPGIILYWSQGSVLAQGFDPKTLSIEPGVTPVAEEVMYTANEYAAFSQAANGLLVYQIGTAMGGMSELFWVDADGARGDLVGQAAQYYDPVFSPDGRRLAVEQGSADIWVIDLVRGSSSRLTFEGANEYNPIWSLDGEWIYFGSIAQNRPSIRRKRASGVGVEEVVVDRPVQSVPMSMSPDGGTMLLMEQATDTGWDILQLDLETQETTPLIATPFVDVMANFGPTPDWVVYQSDETGRMEVYVQKITGVGGRWQISTDGGGKARWSHDGSTIYYLFDGEVYSVDVKVGEDFVAGIPEKIFAIDFRGGAMRPYDVTRDGSRFLFVLAEQTGDTGAPMTLVQNWTRMLER